MRTHLAVSFEDYLIDPENRRVVLYNLSHDIAYEKEIDYTVDCFKRFFDWVRPFGEPDEEKYFQLLRRITSGRDEFFFDGRWLIEHFINSHWSDMERPFVYRLNGENTWRDLDDDSIPSPRIVI